jgi:polysaccharide pyruvyl transferase WcaK-like protein
MLIASAFAAQTRAARLAEGADLIIAVGGAYLRGGSRTESVKSWGAHFGQLKIAAQHGHKSVYLPQSIGPYSGRYRQATVELLGRLACVMVRDDKSFSELKNHARVERIPDMAIIEWARAYESPGALSEERPVFVARDLQNPRNYYRLLQAVAESDRFEWAVQATGSANNDYPVTERYATAPPRLLSEIFAEERARVIVSTRLHGSLSALLAGHPTVHLTYERKGWSAFEDLGLEDFVISARDATLDEIVAKVERIREEPERYWSTVAASIPRILAASERVEEEIRGAYVRGSAG